MYVYVCMYVCMCVCVCCVIDTRLAKAAASRGNVIIPRSTSDSCQRKSVRESAQARDSEKVCDRPRAQDRESERGKTRFSRRPMSCLRVCAFGFADEDFRFVFKVRGFGSKISGLRVRGFGSQISGFGASDFGFRVSGSLFRVAFGCSKCRPKPAFGIRD